MLKCAKKQLSTPNLSMSLYCVILIAFLLRKIINLTSLNHSVFIFDRFYPVVLCISCIFLLATIFVYTKYDELLNHYTRIMRHFAISMFFAFFVLIINQTTDFVEESQAICKVIGKKKFEIKDTYIII